MMPFLALNFIVVLSSQVTQIGYHVLGNDSAPSITNYTALTEWHLNEPLAAYKLNSLVIYSVF